MHSLWAASWFADVEGFNLNEIEAQVPKRKAIHAIVDN
jgi:hypothetical protein